MECKKIFPVRKGTRNNSIDYELNWILYLSSKCLGNDEVEDFGILRNVDGFGSWDDIVFNVKMKNKEWTTDLLQVKWTNKPKDKKLTWEDLNKTLTKTIAKTKGKSDLHKIRRFSEVQEKNNKVILGSYGNLRLIYLTNKSADEIVTKKIATPTVMYDTSRGTGIGAFGVDYLHHQDQNSEKEAEDFCSKLILCSNQKGTENLFEACQELFKQKYRLLGRGINIVRSSIERTLEDGIVLTMDMFKERLYYAVLRRMSKDCLSSIPKLSEEFEVEFDFELAQLTEEVWTGSKNYASGHCYKFLLNKMKAVLEKLEDKSKSDQTSRVFFLRKQALKQLQIEIAYFLERNENQVLVLDNFEWPTDKIQLGNNKVVKLSNTSEGEQAKIDWTDLSETTRRKLRADKRIYFQGTPVSLGDMMHFNQLTIDEKCLNQIMKNRSIEFGQKITTNGVLYYNRKVRFNGQKVIKQPDEISEEGRYYLLTNVKNVKTITMNNVKAIHKTEEWWIHPDNYIYVTDAEAEVCHEYFFKLIQAGRTVHWFNEVDGKLSWVRSSTHELNLDIAEPVPDELMDDTYLTDCKNRLIVLNGDPGIGKTAMLNHIANSYKLKNPTTLVALIQLTSVTSLLQGMNDIKSKDDVINFILEWYQISNGDYEKNMIENMLRKKNRCFVLFDGLDEIYPDYAEKVIKMINITMAELPVIKLFVSTRRNVYFNDTLPVYTIEPLTLEEKKELSEAADTDSVLPELKEMILNFDSPVEIRLCNDIIVDKPHCRKDMFKLLQNLVKNKVDIALRDKEKAGWSISRYKYTLEDKIKQINEEYGRLALYRLFDVITDQSQIDNYHKKLRDGTDRVGIITSFLNNKPIFTNQIYAEYFAALILSDEPEINSRKLINS